MTIKIGCGGVFDYKLHKGHIAFLKWASSFGNLIVFVCADQTVLEKKNRFPIYNQEVRQSNLLKTGLVFETIALTDGLEKDISIICSVPFDLYCFGRDQRSRFDLILSNELGKDNISIKISALPKTIHTTDILKKEGLI